MDNIKLVYLFLAIGMTVLILAPIWPSEDAMIDIFLEFGIRTGLVVPCCGPGYDSNTNSSNFELMEIFYNVLRMIFMAASFAFTVFCVACAGSKKTWSRIALLSTIVIQVAYILITLLVSWELFKYPGSLATIVLIAVAAKFSYDDLLELRSQPL